MAYQSGLLKHPVFFAQSPPSLPGYKNSMANFAPWPSCSPHTFPFLFSTFILFEAASFPWLPFLVFFLSLSPSSRSENSSLLSPPSSQAFSHLSSSHFLSITSLVKLHRLYSPFWFRTFPLLYILMASAIWRSRLDLKDFTSLNLNFASPSPHVQHCDVHACGWTPSVHDSPPNLFENI